MANPIVNYAGENITCYPGSNQQDEGKLNIEFNMARLVTRLSSKNFCIIKPSFALTLDTDVTTGAPLIRVATGQASINGMDLIMNSSITIGQPETTGKWYLAFKLARDSSNNVLGDLVYGSSVTFKGVYLTYFDSKPNPITDPDILYLGSVNWDGSNFSDLEEDEDKYGRIWAEDIMCKFLDPKHPDVTRLNLQEYIYNIPDWYMSKEGDTIYGPLIISDNRTNNNPGIIMNVDPDGSHITFKDPTKDNNLLQFYGDVNRDGIIDNSDLTLIQNYINGTETFSNLQKILADVNHDGIIDEKDIEYITNFINQTPDSNYGDTGNIYYIDNSSKGINFDIGNNRSGFELGKASIYQDESDDILHIHNTGDICIDAEGAINIEADSEINLSTESNNSPKLTINDNEVKISDPNSLNNNFIFDLNDFSARFTLGKAIWTYEINNKVVKLLQDNVDYMIIVPNSDYAANLRVRDTILLGYNNSYGSETSYIKKDKIQITNNDASILSISTPGTETLINNTADASYFLTKDTNGSTYSKLFNSGKLELHNINTTPTLLFTDNNSSYNVSLTKTIGSKLLNLDGALSVNNTITSSGVITGNGLKTSSGVITFTRGTNDGTITKDNNATTLRTNGALYIGASGTSNLYAGATTLGNTTVNGTITGTGNWSTTGTITGSKVYNAVYNDYAEVFKKPKNEIIEYGDLVCIREDGLAHKVSEYSDIARIVGIRSNTVGVLLGGEGLYEDEKVEVGMVGQIWVNTNDNNIAPGRMVKALSNGTVGVTYKIEEKFGIALTNVENGQVKIVYNG